MENNDINNKQETNTEIDIEIGIENIDVDSYNLDEDEMKFSTRI